MKKLNVRNPIHGFGEASIIDQIKSGQLEEILYVDGEGIIETKKPASRS